MIRPGALTTQEHAMVPGVVELPTVVQEALDHQGDHFPSECRRCHFAEYPAGLLVDECKTVMGINGDFARTTDQSCLHRLLTEAPWQVDAMNGRWLERLQKDPATRYGDYGFIPIANILIDRERMLIPEAGRYWGHAQDRYKFAQEYLFLDWVCTGGKYDPLELRACRAMVNEGLYTTLSWAIEQVTRFEQPCHHVLTRKRSRPDVASGSRVQ